jgi:hypothetical protein
LVYYEATIPCPTCLTIVYKSGQESGSEKYFIKIIHYKSSLCLIFHSVFRYYHTWKPRNSLKNQAITS